MYEGQSVRVKVGSYPFTSYSYLIGKIIEISDDAIKDDNLGDGF